MRIEFKNTFRSSLFSACGALFLAGSFGLSERAHAQLVTVTCTDPGNVLTQAQCDTVFDQLETELNSYLPSVETGQYTQGVANANAMASTGVGSVIGSGFQYALVGAGVGLGADLGDSSLSDLLGGGGSFTNFAGVGAQGSVVLGINPGLFLKDKIWIIEPDRARIYLSFLSMSRVFSDISTEFSNFGLVGTYKIIPGKSFGANLFKWGGVDILSGIKYSSFSGSFTIDLPAVSQTAGPASATVAAAPATIAADSSNFSIPIEASTSFRALYILNFTTSLGADLNFGSTTGSGTYETTVTGNLGSAGEANLDLGSNSSPTLANLRASLGLNFEFVVGSLNLGVQKSLTAGVWGVNAGFNLFW